MDIKEKRKSKTIRHLRVRQKIKGTSARPRLNVYRSLKHIYAQIIDDERGATLVQASSLKVDRTEKAKKDLSVLVGTQVAAAAKEKGIKQVVFDRGASLYHGRVKALAEAARKAGLEF